MTPELPFALTLGAITFLLTAIWGSPFVEVLRACALGKQIRDTRPGHASGQDRHADNGRYFDSSAGCADHAGAEPGRA